MDYYDDMNNSFHLNDPKAILNMVTDPSFGTRPKSITNGLLTKPEAMTRSYFQDGCGGNNLNCFIMCSND